MIFHRLIWAGLGAALLVGTVQTGVQQWQAVPIILAAEVYEGQKVEVPVSPEAHTHAPGAASAHDHHHDHAASKDAAEEWTPKDGAERMFWTWVANVIYALSMALLVFAVMGGCLWRGATLGSLPLACAVAAAGWLSLHFWPSLGLPAEIPGMDAARLGSRQGWWVLAAGSAALACASLAALRSPLSWAAATACMALPYLVGAPHIVSDPLVGFSVEAQTQLRQLGTKFIWATTWVSLSFWVSMGLVCGLVFRRWLRPTLASTFDRFGFAPASSMKVPQ
jgi:cobalt transporter subunit CbtA